MKQAFIIKKVPI